MFLDESEYSCIGCHSKWSGSITDRLMMVLHACLCVVVLLVWCVVWELKSVLCSIRFRHNCVLCCDDVYWWNGMLWQCTGTPLFLVGCWCAGLIPYMFFWSYWGHVFWCGLVVFEKLLWCLLVGTFVWGAESWGALVCLVFCVLIVFCFVSSSLFFESYGIMRLLFVL